MASKDSFGARSELTVNGTSHEIFRISAVEGSQRLPYSHKVLLENLLRTEDGANVTADQIRALGNWDASAQPTEEIQFTPARVIMQDFTGVPCVVDLATMREAVLEHLDKEEQVLFPMILRGHGRLAVGPVHVMEIEHDEHGRNLQELRRLTGDMQPPAHACPTWRALYLGLQQLERELMEHIHLENNVLFRRALVA